MTLAAGSQLGPYRIVSQLGAGGMGVVYQAHDPRLDRSVAIKLLPPDLTRDDTAKQRFLQEAKAASALDHPNICTIHEINETDDGQLYLVMAYYEGETLKERIAGGPLALNDAIDIATQVSEGLAEAHRAGIVHRDIKPANLLVTKTGVAKILDFGLAKLAGSEGVTQTGTTVGTVAYMSPEQAKGQEVDQRTDIWSLGVVLYEMLAGTPPFQGENLLSISNAITGVEPAALVGSSASVQPVVGRALSKDQALRYQAVGEMVAALRISASGSKAVTAAMPSQADIPSIAVLPFDDMSPANDQAYFCEGMAEEIINALTGLEGLRVAARTSSSQCKEQKLSVARIGQTLKVSTVLEGSVRKAGNRLRITAQLISVDDGFHLWSERYDREMEDVFTVQDDIAHAVVDKLKVDLLGTEARSLVTQPTDNLEAYNLVLQGRYYALKLAAPAMEKALEYFARALDLEPSYAEAHAGLALTQASRSVMGFGPARELMPAAKEASLKALAIDETVADAHAAMALFLHYYEWDWTGAEREYRRAIDLNPGDTYARSVYTLLLGLEGRDDESEAEARAAVERDPLSIFNRHVLALALYLARRYDAAIAEARAGLELDPAYHLFYWHIGLSSLGLGRRDEAVEAFRQAVRLVPSDVMSQAYLGWALGFIGQREEATAIRAGLERRRSEEYIGGFFLATVCVGLGDYDQAIAWLEQSIEERYGWMTVLNNQIVFDPLRSTPRFQTLLKKMNIAATAVTPEHLVLPDLPRVEEALDVPALTEVPSIAVLPFRSMSADPEQEYFCEGMAEELIDALAKLDGLRVVARTSSFQFKRQSPDLREVGSKLNVKTVLEGSVRKAGNRLRINAQLINAADGYHLWSQRYDREMDDVFVVQDEIAQAVVEKLKVKLFGSVKATVGSRPVDNLEAYNLVLKGLFYVRKLTTDGLAKGLECFTQAAGIAPQYARAHAGIADAYTFNGTLGWAAPHSVMPLALEAARRAVDLDDSDADAYRSLGHVLQFYEWDWVGAEQAYRRALEHNPGDARTHTSMAVLMGVYLGRSDSAIAEARRAVDLDPLSADVNRQLALVFLAGKRFEAAQEQARWTLELDSKHVPVYWDLGQAMIEAGAPEEAVVVLRQARELDPDDIATRGHLGRAYAVAGRRPDALKILQELEQLHERSYAPSIYPALIHLGLDDKTQALSWLEQGYEDRDGLLPAINTWPPFDPLRSDPRFQALLKKMNFPAPLQS